MMIQPGLLVATQPASASTTQRRRLVHLEVVFDQARQQLPQLRHRQRRGPDFFPAASPDSGTTRPAATGFDDGASLASFSPGSRPAPPHSCPVGSTPPTGAAPGRPS